MAEIALIVLVFHLHVPGAPPEPNEPDYLGKARHYWNPDWAGGDLFLESADAHWVFYTLFGWVTLGVSFSTAAWIGRLATWICLAWAWRQLSITLLPGRGVAVLTATLYIALNERFQLAGEWVVGGVEAKGFAYACVFAALASLVRGQWKRSLAWAGVASALHPIIGLWCGACLASSWFLVGRGRPSVVSLLPGIVAAGLIAAIGVLPVLAMDMGTDAATRATAHTIYVFGRLRHHLLPEAFHSFFVLRHLMLFAAWVAIACWTPRTDVWRRLRGFVWGAVFIAAAGLAIDLLTRFDDELRAALLRFYWFRATDAILPLGVAVGIVTIVRRLSADRPHLGRVLFGGLCVLAAIHLLEYDGGWRLRHRAPRAERAINLDDWRDVCNWIKQNTPRDAIFITPRYNQTFKWHAGRAEVATWKDLPQDAVSIVEWDHRLRRLRLTREERLARSGRETLAWLGAERLLKVGSEYHASYVVTIVSDDLALPVVHGNGTYAVYELRPTDVKRESTE